MLGLLRRRLADLGTAKKLAIGFTLVLLLTALVAALAVLSLHALGQRFARLQEMSAINRDVLEVRQAEKEFALHGEKSDAERLRQRLAATLERVGRLKADGDADQALGMAEVEQVLAAYLEAFGRFEQSIQGRQLAWESASWSLNGAANSLDILQSSLAEDGAYALKESQGHDGEPLLQQAAQVAQVNRLVLQGLDEARSRLEARAADAQEGPPKSLREALELAARLEQAITDDAYVSVVKDVLTNIRGFADKLAEYRASQLQERQMYAAMGERAGQVMARVDRSWEAQQQAMLHSLRTNSLLIVGAAVLALLVGLGAAFGISLLIVRPLRQAMGVAQRIAEGDLAVRVDSERRDEVGQLMAAMRAMTGSLRGIVSQLQDGVGRIAGASEALSGVTTRTRLGIDSQRAETEQVATAMNQMAATVHEVAHNAEEAAGAAESADGKVSVGQEVVRQTLERIERLAEAVRAATASVEALSADSQRIGSVLDVIKSVAEQRQPAGAERRHRGGAGRRPGSRLRRGRRRGAGAGAAHPTVHGRDRDPDRCLAEWHAAGGAAYAAQPPVGGPERRRRVADRGGAGQHRHGGGADPADEPADRRGLRAAERGRRGDQPQCHGDPRGGRSVGPSHAVDGFVQRTTGGAGPRTTGHGQAFPLVAAAWAASLSCWRSQ